MDLAKDRLTEVASSLAAFELNPIKRNIAGRIAYIVSHGASYASNGYAIRTQGVAEALNMKGFETLCFVRPGRPWELDESANVNTQEVVNGVRYIHAGKDGIFLPESEEEFLRKSVDYYVQMFQLFRPQFVMAGSDYKVGLPALVAASQLGLPFFNEVRGFWEFSQATREPSYVDSEEYLAQSIRDTYVAAHSAGVFTLNETMKQELIARGVQSDLIQLVPNGLSSIPQSNIDSKALRSSLGIDVNDKVIGYIGSFNTYEGIEDLIEAVAQLNATEQTVKLLLVGDASAINKLGASNDSIGSAPWLIKTGRIPHGDVIKYFSVIDTIVIPRRNEQVCTIVPPMKIVEAISFGKKVVVSNVPPLQEYADNYDSVINFNAGNVESLLSALKLSVSLPVPQPVTYLLFSNHVEVMVNEFNKWAEKDNAKKSASNAVMLKSPAFDIKKPKIKAISIMDEISEECWRYEMTSYPISRANYAEQVASSTANFCFLESCWKGNRGTWEYAFTSPGLKHNNAQALLDLIPKVKQKMPIVFWNKEDPMHYDKYLPIAKYADVIFTTDSEKVDNYKADVPEADVYAVPFAAQQKICNPSGRFKSESESVCFAGSYYGVGHDERKRQMDALLPSIIEFEGAIYDRMSKIDSDRYKFPPQYAPFIRDAVPFTEVVQLYKRFKVFLNVNTIVESPTMMSRRVYELLACGTPVVSTPSKAIEEQFSGIVQVAKDADEANVIIERLLTDEHYWEKTSHLGYREVMTKHTYAHRLVNIEKAIGINNEREAPLVSIITCTRRPEMIDRIVTNMARQNHANIELILVLQGFSQSQSEELIGKLKSVDSNIKRVTAIINDSEETLGERFNKAAEKANGEYIAKMDDDDFYFANYLKDMLIPFTFGDYAMVGKKELYMYLSGSQKLIKRFPGMKHQTADFVAGPTFVIKKEVFDKVKFESRNTGEDSSFVRNLKTAGYNIYAADPFNFIQFRADPKSHTWVVPDEEILAGSQTVEVADFLDESKVDF
ncbi:glycosyltransferase [Alteromonas sp. A081]|uniref:glycosyltransferase n=1 Tax=Alteromonas sp. A081 TaxID=3410269 RepID=UPI003B97EAC3